MCFTLHKNRQSALPCTPHQRGKKTQDSSPVWICRFEWAERSHWWCFCKFSICSSCLLHGGNTAAVAKKLLIDLVYGKHCAVSLLLAATCVLVQKVISRQRKSGLPRSLGECGMGPDSCWVMVRSQTPQCQLYFQHQSVIHLPLCKHLAVL